MILDLNIGKYRNKHITISYSWTSWVQLGQSCLLDLASCGAWNKNELIKKCQQNFPILFYSNSHIEFDFLIILLLKVLISPVVNWLLRVQVDFEEQSMISTLVVLEGMDLVEWARIFQIQFLHFALHHLVVKCRDIWTIVNLAGHFKNLIATSTLFYEAAKQMVFFSPDSLIRL